MSLWFAGFVLASRVHAAPPPSLRVAGEEGACPTPAQVVTVLKRLLRRTEVTPDTGPVSPDDASISDQGSQWRVAVAGQERSFVDPARACAERAQHAAVFIALVVDPLTIAEPPPEPAPRPVAPIPAPAEQPRPLPVVTTSTFEWDVTLGGVLLAAPAARDRRTAVSGGAEMWVRAKRGFHLGVGAGLLRGSLEFTSATANAWWIPLEAVAGFSGRIGASEVGVEIGPRASLLSIVGENVPQAHTEVRLEVGAQASGWFRFWLDRKFAVFLSADAILHPVPYALVVNPDGEVGHTPAIWLGASAGLAAALE